MNEEHSLYVSINAAKAKAGAMAYRAATKTITTSSSLAVRAIRGVTNAINPLHFSVRKLQAMFVTGGIGFAVTKSVKTFATFEKQMAEVNTMLDNSTEHFLPAYTKGIKDMSREFGEGTDTLARGLYDILSASVPAEKALETLDVAARAATAGLSTTGVAADAITSILNSYALEAEEAGSVSDLLFAIVKRGKTTFNELAPSIGKVASIASVAGLSLEEMGAALATMTRAGVRTDIAITGLKAIINTFLNPTNESVEAVKKLGVAFDLTSDSIQRLGLTGIFEQMKELSPEEIVAIFPNIRAFTGVAPAIKNIAGQMDDLAFMTNRAGLTAEAFGKISQTTSFAIERFKKSIVALFDSIGKGFAPLFKKDAESIRMYLIENEGAIEYYARIVAIEVERVQDQFIAFAKYLRSDFGIATEVAWELFLASMETASKMAIELAIRTGEGIWIGVRQGILGRFDADEIRKEAMKRYISLGGEWENVPPKISEGPGGLSTRIRPAYDKPLNEALYNKLYKEVRTEQSNKVVESIYAGTADALTSYKNQFLAKRELILKNVADTEGGAKFALGLSEADQKAEQEKQLALLERHGFQVISKWEMIANAVKEYQRQIAADEESSPLSEQLKVAEKWLAETTTKSAKPIYDPEDIENAKQKLKDLNKELKFELETIWMATEARERSLKTREFENAAIIAYEGDLEKANKATEEYLELLRQVGETERWKEVADSMGQAFADAAEAIILSTDSIENAFRNMAITIANDILQKILFESLAEGISQMIMGMGGESAAGFLPGLFGFSKGAVIPMANGRIINRPTIFPMANGNIGLAGEKGREAVMPLTRTKGGRLGVEAEVNSPKMINDNRVKVVNQFDRSLVKDFIETDEGERVILNVVRKNNRLLSGRF